MTNSPAPGPTPKPRLPVPPRLCLAVLILLMSAVIPMVDANEDISRNRQHITPMKGQDGNEKKPTMAETFHQHKQQITTQRRMRVGSKKTRSNANVGNSETSVESKRRGGAGTGGGNKRGSGNKRRNGSNGNRASKNVGTGATRNKNQTLDGRNVNRGTRNCNKHTGTSRRGGRNGSVNKNGVRGGNGRNANSGSPGTEKTNNTNRVIPTLSKEKAPRNKESIASAVVKKGITLVPVQAPANNEKRKAGKGR